MINLKGQIIVTFYGKKEVLLTKQDTNVLKGIATVMIMAAHLSYILITHCTSLLIFKLIQRTGGGMVS